MRLPTVFTPATPARGRSWMGAVLAIATLGTLLAVAWQGPQAKDAAGQPVALAWERRFFFEDRPNGDIGVVDAATGQEVARFEGEQGFVRGALRALARERMRHGLGPEQPFELSGLANGRVLLQDRATGMRISLESFGPTNAAVFARLKSAAPAAPATPPPAPQGTPS